MNNIKPNSNQQIIKVKSIQNNFSKKSKIITKNCEKYIKINSN